MIKFGDRLTAFFSTTNQQAGHVHIWEFEKFRLSITGAQNYRNAAENVLAFGVLSLTLRTI